MFGWLACVVEPVMFGFFFAEKWALVKFWSIFRFDFLRSSI